MDCNGNPFVSPDSNRENKRPACQQAGWNEKPDLKGHAQNKKYIIYISARENNIWVRINF